MKNLVKKILRFLTPNYLVKTTFEKGEGDLYIYTDYYSKQEPKKYVVFTEKGWGIKWYYDKNYQRCNMVFEGELERLFKLMNRRNVTYIEIKPE